MLGISVPQKDKMHIENNYFSLTFIFQENVERVDINPKCSKSVAVEKSTTFLFFVCFSLKFGIH